MVALARRGPWYGKWGTVGRPPEPLLDEDGPGLVPPFDRESYACMTPHCYRVFTANPEYMDPEERKGWIVAPGKAVRCPSHLSLKALRKAGFPRYRQSYRDWMVEQRALDQGRITMSPLAQPWIVPKDIWDRCFGTNDG